MDLPPIRTARFELVSIISRLGCRQTGVQIDDIDGEELVFELDGWTVTR